MNDFPFVKKKFTLILQLIFPDLSTLAWLHMVDKPKADLVDGSKMTTNKNGSDIATVATRSETGMVGLVNLGNTCYMNSVLQALYITRRFCDVVMSVATNHQQQPVLAKLQKTFAYLRLTLRALYSPSDFLKAARPPWFEPGRQQDCSEFLRYLLDTLQEQEKSVKSDVITNFREHKMIVSKSDSASVASEEESVKNSTSDNSVCLDAIVEEDQPEVNGDVEMLSQEGSEDFGSHMSLQTKEEEDEELEDLSGSRNSLSGLKRWTTEENLSSNGGSRSELMEIPLHDSHSNSTGIHTKINCRFIKTEILKLQIVEFKALVIQSVAQATLCQTVLIRWQWLVIVTTRVHRMALKLLRNFQPLKRSPVVPEQR